MCVAAASTFKVIVSVSESVFGAACCLLVFARLSAFLPSVVWVCVCPTSHISPYSSPRCRPLVVWFVCLSTVQWRHLRRSAALGGNLKLREHYLRTDLSCGSAACEQCTRLTRYAAAATRRFATRRSALSSPLYTTCAALTTARSCPGRRRTTLSQTRTCWCL